MIDKKLEEASKHYAEENAMSIEDQMGDVYDGIEELSDAYKAGAKEAINKLLKDLWHSASEEPKNLEFIVFTNDIFGEIYFFTMQRDNSLQSWETEVTYHGIDQWAYRNDIVSLILKGGKQ